MDRLIESIAGELDGFVLSPDDEGGTSQRNAFH